MKLKNIFLGLLLGGTVASQAQFTDNYSNAAPWTQISTGISVTGGAATYNNCADATQRRIHRNHGLTLGFSWRYDFDFRYTGVGSSGPGHHLASLTAGTLDPVSAGGPSYAATNQDAIAVMFLSTNASSTPSTFMLMGGSKNDANAWGWSAGMQLILGTQYYLRLERLDQTHGRISVFNDAARTVHITGSPQCFTIDANVQANLPVLQHGNTTWGASTRSLTGRIDSSWLNNVVLSPGTILGSQTICRGADPTAVYLNSLPAGATGYQWASSTDMITWTSIPGATSWSYDPPAGLTQTTYYRVWVDFGCGVLVPSKIVTITVQDCCDFSDDFSDPTPWTAVGADINVTSGVASYTNCPDATTNRIHRPHGVVLTNTWRLNFDFIYTGVGDNGPGHHLASVTAGNNDPVSNSSGPTYPATNQDAVVTMFYSTNASDDPSTFLLLGGSKNDANPWQWSSGILLVMNTQYYITLERISQTEGRISVFTDALRTIHATNSPQCFPIDANVQSNLTHIQHGNTSWGWGGRTLTGSIDNDCLTNVERIAGCNGGIPIDGMATGINDLWQQDITQTISPNPSSGWVEIAYPLEQGQSGTMVVYNAAGSIVQTVDLDASGYTRTTLTHLPKGVYLCTLQVNGLSVKTEKLIITD